MSEKKSYFQEVSEFWDEKIARGLSWQPSGKVYFFILLFLVIAFLIGVISKEIF